MNKIFQAPIIIKKNVFLIKFFPLMKGHLLTKELL